MLREMVEPKRPTGRGVMRSKRGGWATSAACAVAAAVCCILSGRAVYAQSSQTRDYALAEAKVLHTEGFISGLKAVMGITEATCPILSGAGYAVYLDINSESDGGTWIQLGYQHVKQEDGPCILQGYQERCNGVPCSSVNLGMHRVIVRSLPNQSAAEVAIKQEMPLYSTSTIWRCAIKGSPEAINADGDLPYSGQQLNEWNVLSWAGRACGMDVGCEAFYDFCDTYGPGSYIDQECFSEVKIQTPVHPVWSYVTYFQPYMTYLNSPVSSMDDHPMTMGIAGNTVCMYQKNDFADNCQASSSQVEVASVVEESGTTPNSVELVPIGRVVSAAERGVAERSAREFAGDDARVTGEEWVRVSDNDLVSYVQNGPLVRCHVEGVSVATMDHRGDWYRASIECDILVDPNDETVKYAIGARDGKYWGEPSALTAKALANVLGDECVPPPGQGKLRGKLGDILSVAWNEGVPLTGCAYFVVRPVFVRMEAPMRLRTAVNSEVMSTYDCCLVSAIGLNRNGAKHAIGSSFHAVIRNQDGSFAFGFPGP